MFDTPWTWKKTAALVIAAPVLAPFVIVLGAVMPFIWAVETLFGKNFFAD